MSTPGPAPSDYSGILADAARRNPGAIAVLDGEEQLSYRVLDAEVDALAAGLQRAGIRPGDRVALCLGNEPAWIVAFFALSRLRACAVMLSTAWREHETAHALSITGPTAVIAGAANADVLDAVGRPARAVVIGSRRPGWLAYDDLTAAGTPFVPVGPADPGDLELALPFSSGTTGLPKAVRHTHRSLVVATEQWREALDIGADDRLQGITPLSHILGIVNVGATFLGGATLRLFRRFDVATMVDSVERDRITIGLTVAPIASALAGLPDIEARDLGSLRYLNWSATPVDPEVARRVTERTGVGWRPAYGTTELPILAINPLAGPVRLDSVGRAVRGVELEAIDPVSLRFLPRGTTGELVARSPAAMVGYLPEDSPDPFLPGGWYRTGDVGSVDADGWIAVTGRLKELIKVSGYQVSPVEIEQVLATSPLVVDCAVFGVPDDRRGEAPCAAVVPAAGWAPDAQELLDWLTPQLAPYKRVRKLYFVEAVPRTPSGKIQRRLLGPLAGA